MRLSRRDRARSISNAVASSIAVPLHQDALRALDQRAAPERALQVLVLGEAPQHDFDRALPVLDVVVVDLGEYPTLGCLADELGVARMEQDDHGAGCFSNDLVDQ